MPPLHHKSITVPDDTFEKFDKWYKFNKECGTIDPGICSFSAFFQQQLDDFIKEKQSLRKITNQILYVPTKFTEIKLVIKTN